jgi:hypothetical protein
VAGSKIKNTVQTEFLSKGAKKVEGDTQRIGKAQTRLGQSSASAGRSFSSQAQGLGGLVGVYAAAAANVFAISAAFAALNRAAQFETIVSGTEQLAAAVGSSATIVVERLKEVTQGQLSVIEAATQANLALSAGFNVDQIGELGEVANKASKALGRNLTDAFQRITRGAIKLEPELLDEIGIFTRIEPAVEAYARELGKAVSQLTQFERRQAFVNQVIKDGQQAFQDVDVSGKSTQKTFERLVANFTDLALVVGKFVADTLEPFAAFLDKNLGNRLILLGGIATIVFQRFGQAIGGFAVTAVGALGTKLEKLAEGFAKAGSSAKALAQQQASIDFSGVGTFAGPRGAGSSIRQTIAAGPLTTAGALDIQEKGNKVKAAEIALQERIIQKTKQTKEQLLENNKQFQNSNRRLIGINASLDLANNKLDTAGKGARSLAKGLRFAGAAATFLGNALGKAFRFINFVLIGFTTLQTVFSFFDVDIFDKLRTFLSGINKEARESAKALETLAEKTRVINDIIRERGADPNSTIIKKTLIDSANKSVQALSTELARVNKDLNKLQSGSAFAKFVRFLTSDEEKLAKIEKDLTEKRKGLELATAGAASEVSRLGSVTAKLTEITKKSDATIGASRDSFEGLKGETDLLVAKLGDMQLVLGKFEGNTFKSFGDAFVKVGQGITEADTKAKDLRDTILGGEGISAERASRDFGTIVMLLEKAKKEAEELGDVQVTKIDKELQKIKDTLGKVVGEFTTLDALSKKISKMFSGEFKFLDDRFLTGKVSAETGKVAVNEAEILKNRSQNFQSLKDQIAIEENALIPNQGKINKLKEIEGKLVKVSFANLLKQPPLQEKLRIAQEKALKALEAQVELQRLNNEALQNQIDRQTKLNALKDTAATAADNVRFAQAENALAQTQAELAEKRLKSEVDILKARQANEKLTRQSALLERQFVTAAANQAGAVRVDQAKNQLAKAEERTLLRSERGAELRIQAAKIERDEGLARIKRQNQLAFDEFENSKKDIAARRVILKLESDQLEKRISNEINSLNKQESLRQLEIKQRKASEAATLQGLRDRITAASEQRNIQNIQAKNQKDQRDAQLNILLGQQMLLKDQIAHDLEVIKARKAILAEEAAAVGATLSQDFKNIGTGIGDVSKNQDANIALIRKQLTESENLLNGIIEKNNLNFKKTSENIESEISRKERSFEINKQIDALNLKKFLEQKSALKEEKGFQLSIIAEKLKGLSLEDELVAKNLGIKLRALGFEEDKIKQIFDIAKEKAEFELSYQKRINDAIISSADILNNSFVSGMMDLNTALLDGTLNAKNFTEGLRDFLGETFRKLQADFFQKTVAEPVSNFLTEGIFSALDLTNEQGIDAVKLEAGSVPVIEKGGSGIVNSFKDEAEKSLDGANKKTETLGSKFSSFLDELVEKGRSSFSSIGSFLTDVLAKIGNSMGAKTGGLFDSILSGAGNLFGGGPGAGMSAVTPFTTLGGVGVGASGGVVPFSAYQRLASGGMARDRVPALLEPGEFVLKRSAARNIGNSNLQAMNAGGMPNIKVQVKNEGTPQEATTATPRMDVDAIVIDIVTRDLRNNGPIRKSMRGGA